MAVAVTATSAGTTPILLADVELSSHLPELASRPDGSAGRARLLVRLHGHPLGLLDVTLPPGGLDPARLAAAIWCRFSRQIARHMTGDGGPQPLELRPEGLPADETPPCSWRCTLSAGRPSAAVVVTTCAASEQLVHTLTTALDQDYRDFEVIVVDNRPRTSSVRQLLADLFPSEPRLCYVSEPRSGLSRSRNAGLRAATAQVIAFTDDDVVLDVSWLSWLVAGFQAAEGVACVTGLILPLELSTTAQLWLEEYGGYGKGFEPRVWDLHRHRLDHPLYPYTVGIYGSGANAAFQRAALLELGGFDDHLGAGTPAQGGEDLDIYTTMVLSGRRILYQPAALLRHRHPREERNVRRLIRRYGTGLSAMLTKHLVQGRDSRRVLLRCLPAGLMYLLDPRSPKHAGKSADYPLRLTLLEVCGMAYGPIGYARSRLSE